MRLYKALPMLGALVLLICGCSNSAPEATPEISPPASTPRQTSSTPAPEVLPERVESAEMPDTSQYDAYSSARRQMTRHYSEYVGNYSKTFGSGKTVQLPIADATHTDPYINISIPVLIDVDRGALEAILAKPLEFSGSGKLAKTYSRLHSSLSPLETAYKAARDYYLNGDAQEDGFSRAQELHDAMIKASEEYTGALDEFAAELRVLEKLRREQTLRALLDAGHKVRYDIESMLAFGGDISSYLKAFDDEKPLHKGDADDFRPYVEEFSQHADAVLEYTGEDLLKEGFKSDFSHMFPSFFTSVMKMRIIANNILVIMEKGDMGAPLPTLPPDIDNLGMDPEEALSSFAENHLTASKLYGAFISKEDGEG